MSAGLFLALRHRERTRRRLTSAGTSAGSRLTGAGGSSVVLADQPFRLLHQLNAPQFGIDFGVEVVDDGHCLFVKNIPDVGVMLVQPLAQRIHGGLRGLDSFTDVHGLWLSIRSIGKPAGEPARPHWLIIKGKLAKDQRLSRAGDADRSCDRQSVGIGRHADQRALDQLLFGKSRTADLRVLDRLHIDRVKPDADGAEHAGIDRGADLALAIGDRRPSIRAARSSARPSRRRRPTCRSGSRTNGRTAQSDCGGNCRAASRPGRSRRPCGRRWRRTSRIRAGPIRAPGPRWI